MEKRNLLVRPKRSRGIHRQYQDGGILSYQRRYSREQAPAGGSLNYFDGIIDSVRYYSRALPASEIVQNYNATDIEFQTSTSSDEITWEDWKPITSESQLDSFDSNPSSDYYTASFLHLDGNDASTNFRDESGKTWTAASNAQIDTAESKFGGASGLFDRASDVIKTPDHADFTLGSGDFTIDFRMRLAASGLIEYVCGHGGTSASGTNAAWKVAIDNSPALRIYIPFYAGTTAYMLEGGTLSAINTWALSQQWQYQSRTAWTA